MSDLKFTSGLLNKDIISDSKATQNDFLVQSFFPHLTFYQYFIECKKTPPLQYHFENFLTFSTSDEMV